jgi:hypothetical protein
LPLLLLLRWCAWGAGAEKDLRQIIANLRQENTQLRHRLRQVESRSKGAAGGGLAAQGRAIATDRAEAAHACRAGEADGAVGLGKGMFDKYHHSYNELRVPCGSDGFGDC